MAAGCAAPASPVVEKPAETPKLADAAAPATPNASTEDAGSRVMIDSVNDAVGRVDRILAQRAQGRQMADDIAEQRGARAAGRPKPADEAAEIERLAADLRKKPAAAAAVDQPVVANAAPPSYSSDLHGTLAVPTKVEIERSAADVDPMLAISQRYAGRLARDPKSLDAQLDMQLVRFLKDDAAPDGRDLAPLPSEDRELLSAVGDALTNFRGVVRSGPNAMGAEKARPFIEMADRIRARSDLSISSMSLCQSVKAYGVYEPIEPLRFTLGEPNRAVFYCEVDGFLSQLGEKGLWSTELSLALRLFSDANIELWTPPPEKVIDASRKRRRDFFIAKKIALPASLTPGRYFLKASVQDLQANRVAEQTITVDLVAK